MMEPLVIPKNISTSHVSDALGRANVPDGLYPLNPTLTMFGPAFPVRLVHGDNLALHKAVKEAPAGSVLVADGGGCTMVALWGELMTHSALAHGIAGVVIDGAIRDEATLSQLDFPVFAKGATPRGPARVSMGALNVPIQCGGVVVQPGDYIFGDCDGLVVIPKDKFEETLIAAQKVADREQALEARVKQGEYLWDIFKLG